MQLTSSNKQSIIALSALFLLFIWSINKSPEFNMPDVNQIPTADAYALIKEGNTLVLDVREKAAYDKGHLPGAISVPIGELDTRMEEFSTHKTAEVIVYCNDGSTRGPRATKKLNDAGFPDAKNLKGGVEGWRAANHPLKTN